MDSKKNLEILKENLKTDKKNILCFVNINEVQYAADAILEYAEFIGVKNKASFDAGLYNCVQNAIYEENVNGIMTPRSCGEWYFDSNVIDVISSPNSLLIIKYTERVTDAAALNHLLKLIQNRVVSTLNADGTTKELSVSSLKYVITVCEKDDLVFPVSESLRNAYDLIIE